MIHLLCACGTSMDVLDVYAGGHVICTGCGASVLVPADAATLEEKFRFQCPHCHTRVVARRASAGKKSQCPACGETYVVPDPPDEPGGQPEPDDKRIRIDADELGIFNPLPFAVGKLDRGIPARPEARYIHPADSPAADSMKQTQEAQTLPSQDSPTSPKPYTVAHRPATPPLPQAPPYMPLPMEAPGFLPPPMQPPPGYLPPLPPLPPVVGGPDHFGSPDFAGGPYRGGPEWAVPVPASSFPTPEPNSIPTAAELPQIPSSSKPASVGELQVISGSCRGQRIRMDFHRFVVGAERDCDLRPSSSVLSRHHCVFKKDEYALRIRDLGSTSGTFVNGRRIIGEVVLNPGDEVTVGDVTISIALPHTPAVTHSMADSNPSISDFVIL